MTLGDLLHTAHYSTKIKIIYAKIINGETSRDMVFEGLVDDRYNIMNYFDCGVWDIVIKNNTMEIFI